MTAHRIKKPIRFPAIMIVIAMICCLSPISFSSNGKENRHQSADKLSIQLLTPDKRGGRAYKLTYHMEVPVETYWRFKTDFDNDFLTKNKFIKAHHLISHYGNKVVTKDKYSSRPNTFFRWQTTIHFDARRLDFILLNPEQCGQKFHYGHIQLEATDNGTKVTQIAYFDFWGVSFWVHYPWKGGMKDFLSYTAKWERNIVLKLRSKYAKKPET